MQVNDIPTDKKNKRNTYSDLSNLTWLLKILSLNSDADNSEQSLFFLVKIVFLGLVFGFLTFYSLYYKIIHIYKDINVSIKVTDVVQTTYDYCQYLVDLLFVYKYGRHIGVEYFKQYDILDQILGITSSLPVKSKMRKLITFFTLIWLITSCCDFGAWVLSYGWFIPIAYGVSYIYLYIKILTTLDLTCHVMSIEIRLEIIGDLLQEYYSSVESYPGLMGDSILCNKKWLYFKRCSRVSDLQLQNNPIKLIAFNNHHEIKWLTRSYLMLTEQIAFINNMYGLRILLNSLSLVIDMVRYINIGVRIAVGSQLTAYYSGYFPAICSFMRLLTCIAVMVSLVKHCEQAYSQKDRIIRIIDHLLINKNPSDDLRTAAIEFRELLENRPISFNMANFFILNYSFLTSIASTVVTYTIILLQSMN